MFRTFTFLFAVAALFAVSNRAVAQTTPPPGPPFDASKHPNPIVTFVETKAFKTVAPDQVRKESGIDLLGLSQAEGARESLEIADGRFVKNMSILTIRTDVTYYPTVRQTFKLSEGGQLILHSFRVPKVALPADFTRIVLNEAALERKKKPAEMRFGGAKPETLEIRGAPALLFEEKDEITVYWQEDGVGHTATSRIPRRELFQVIDDLL